MRGQGGRGSKESKKIDLPAAPAQRESAAAESTCGSLFGKPRRAKRLEIARVMGWAQAAVQPPMPYRTCSLRLRRPKEEIDGQQYDEQNKPGAKTAKDQLLLDRQQGFVLRLFKLFAEVRLRHFRLLNSADERRFDAMEEEPGNDQPDPDDEAEKADHIDCRELANACLPELAEVRQDPDRKEGENEEDDPEDIGFADRRGELRRLPLAEPEGEEDGG